MPSSGIISPRDLKLLSKGISQNYATAIIIKNCNIDDLVDFILKFKVGPS